MKKRIVRAAAILMSMAVMVTGCRVGGKNIRITTGLSDSDLFKIDGSKFSVSEAKMYLTTEKNVYEESFGSDLWDKNVGDVTFEEYVKENLKDRLAQIKTLNLLAKNKKIRLSDDETTKAHSAAEKYFSGLNDEEKDYMKIELSDVESAYESYLLAEKVYDEIVKDVNPEISDADEKVIKVASIYIKTFTVDENGNRVDYTGEEKENAKNKINDILKQIKEGSDFISVAEDKTEADEIEYTFGKGEMLQEFEDTAFALKTDEVSEVVETEDGYFIIKCINDYLEEETQKNKEEMILEAKNKAFLEVYEPFVDTLSSEFNAKAWEKIKFSDMNDVKVANFYQCIEE